MWRDLEEGEIQPPKIINLEDRFDTLEKKISEVQERQSKERTDNFFNFAITSAFQIMILISLLLVLRNLR